MTKLNFEANNKKLSFKLELNLDKEIVRIKENNKLRRLFHRLFGHDKAVIKALLKEGYTEGVNEIDTEKFIISLDNISSKNRIHRALKYIKKEKYSFDQIKWDKKKMPIKNVKGKRVIKKLMKEDS